MECARRRCVRPAGGGRRPACSVRAERVRTPPRPRTATVGVIPLRGERPRYRASNNRRRREEPQHPQPPRGRRLVRTIAETQAPFRSERPFVSLKRDAYEQYAWMADCIEAEAKAQSLELPRFGRGAEAHARSAAFRRFQERQEGRSRAPGLPGLVQCQSAARGHQHARFVPRTRCRRPSRRSATRAAVRRPRTRTAPRSRLRRPGRIPARVAGPTRSPALLPPRTSAQSPRA